MATFHKRGTRWQAQVCVKGQRASRTFRQKREAMQWALDKEAELESASGKKPGYGKTVLDIFDRYGREVTPTKKSPAREYKALNRLAKDEDFMAVRLPELGPRHVAAWRDRRLKEVSGASVDREMNIISHAFNTARKEWEWLDKEITKDVRRPSPTPPRSYLPTKEVIGVLCESLGGDLSSISGRVGQVFRFALETGMRQKEIANLEWRDIEGRTVVIRDSKTMAGLRKVPLSKKTLTILDRMKGVDKVSVFALKTSQIESMFRKAKKMAGFSEIHFHDSRHYALTHLSKKLSVMELAKMAGIKDLRILQNVYFNPDIEELADKLD